MFLNAFLYFHRKTSLSLICKNIEIMHLIPPPLQPYNSFVDESKWKA